MDLNDASVNFSEIKTKSILSPVKQDDYFGIRYNMNLYRGCQHGCIYCDSRSKCYQLGELSRIRIKKNATDLLRKELKGKRQKGTIGTGSMNDPYMPLEKVLGLTRRALQAIADFKFPIHIITKGNIITRDLDIIKDISKTYAAASFTITTFDDNLARKLEPAAPLSSERFHALYELSRQGIYTGITLMPLLPHINDNAENISNIVRKAADSGAQYILPAFGVSLREGSRDYLFKTFDQKFPGMKEQYQSQFGNRFSCYNDHCKQLYDVFYNLIAKLNMPGKMKFYSGPVDSQLSLF